MNCIKTALAVGGAALVLAASGGSALAESNGGGNSSNAPGQANAITKCTNTIDRQTAKGVSAGGGPKQGVPAPTNCDHFFGAPGQNP
jgi:hypothetical protein